MSAELDMSQYLDLFLQEAEEQLEILEQEMVKLEEEPTDDRLQAIFRAAHTLKGSSRAMGFANFAELTHEMENILDLLRSGKMSVTTHCADCLLAGIDMLVQMKESIADGKGDKGVEPRLLVSQLKEIASGAPETPQAPAPASTESGPTGIPADVWDALDLAQQEKPVHHLRIRLAEDCAMKFVRVFMVVSAIQTDGEVLTTYPTMEDLEEERFDLAFEMVIQSARDIEELRASLSEITEVRSVEMSPWVRPDQVEAVPAPVEIVPAPVAEAAPVEAGPVEDDGQGKKPRAVKKSEASQTVRVDVTRLDTLMNLVGELVIDRTRISQIGSDMSQKISDPLVDSLNEAVGHIARISSDLQDQIMKARMMPIDTVFNRFPRVVRDLANKLGKDVRLELNGGDTELDRSVIEVIGDPLLHLIRNSLDHGLEKPEEREAHGKPSQGLLQINARHLENHIVIEIIDDGRGINPDVIRSKSLANGTVTADQLSRMSDKEVLQMIFASGFSTAKQVSEVSGRGVGMDIVRSNLAKLGGLIDLESKVGQGTSFTLRLPLTLAIIRGLLVRVCGRVYVLPLGSVVETLLLKPDEVQKLNKREVIVLRGVTTPLVRLEGVFEVPGDENNRKADEDYVVIVGLAEQRVGLVVNELIGEQEVVIKSLSRFLGEAKGVSGATILGDGRVALIVDVNSVIPMERG